MSLFLALGVGLAIAVVLVVVLGGDDAPKTASTTTEETEDEVTDDDTPQPTQPVQPDEPTVARAQPVRSSSAEAAAADLERELKRQKLWGTATVFDRRIDIRSGSCEARDMVPMVDAARARLQDAGLTKLRCLAQSGAVVFERDL